MIIIFVIRSIFDEIKTWIARVLKRAILQKKYKTSKFYSGSSVDTASSLGRYNVIFSNTIVINSTIGDHSIVQSDSRVMNADIGKFTSISSRVRIGLGRHPTDMVSTHAAFYSSSQPVAKTFCRTDNYSPFKRIRIGNDVTIFDNVMIMDGVTIGDGAVLAMGSVVTADVAAYAVVAGNPARLMMYRFNDEIRTTLISTRWWDNSDEWLEKNCEFFKDLNTFVKKFTI